MMRVWGGKCVRCSFSSRRTSFFGWLRGPLGGVGVSSLSYEKWAGCYGGTVREGVDLLSRWLPRAMAVEVVFAEVRGFGVGRDRRLGVCFEV